MGSADFAQSVRGAAQRLQNGRASLQMAVLPCIPEERSARGIRPWLTLRQRVYISSREGSDTPAMERCSKAVPRFVASGSCLSCVSSH
jgi:hypothetical protein